MVLAMWYEDAWVCSRRRRKNQKINKLTGEEDIFSTSWMFSQMTSLEDIGAVFVMLFFYNGSFPPVCVYVCANDMAIEHFRVAVERFISILDKLVSGKFFKKWYRSNFMWLDFPFRFSYIRVFIHKRHLSKKKINYPLGVSMSTSWVTAPITDGVHLSDLDKSGPFPDYVVLWIKSN